MPAIRGFVQKIDVGRAGLVSVTVVHEDTSTGVYVIRDLDADPERFNERLSKLGVLRDAMTRAEPVEIEFEARESANEIARAVRITRDSLVPPRKQDLVAGLVVQVTVATNQGIAANGFERSDTALVTLLTLEAGLQTFVLELQAPERLVASDQLRMLLDAEAATRAVALTVEPVVEGRSRILAVAVEDAEALGGTAQGQDVSGFVESLSLIQIASGPLSATFAHVRFTTAPAFAGPGNVISGAPFTPMTLDLLVPKNSLTYNLVEAGLRDNLRMRVRAQPMKPTREGGDTSTPADRPPVNVRQPLGAAVVTTATKDGTEYFLALAAELLAPLASASRPVWIEIERESLDRGPETGCADGVPSSDLSVKTLRDLKIPYTAVWKGLGCFNDGVYRIQVEADSPIGITFDGKPLCIHDSDNPKVKFAYVCVCECCHRLEVRLDSWVCDQTFQLDVYQLR